MVPCRIAVILLLLAFAGPPVSGQVRWITPGGSDIDVDVTGRVYLLDGSASTVRIYDDRLKQLGEYGGPGWGEGEFDRPSGIWARNGLDLFVADYGNHRIQRFDRQFNFVSALSTRDAEDATLRFGYPNDVALSRQGELFILDGENQQVVKVDRTSRVERTFGGLSAGAGRLIHPTRLAIGPRDGVFVIDGNRVLAFDGFGNFLRSCYEGVWGAPSAIAGTEDRIVVADGGALTWCEQTGGSVKRMDVEEVAPGFKGEIRAVAMHGGLLYLLGENRCAIVKDPSASGDGSVESKGKNP